MDIKYDKVENYTMKCHLYPNKTAAKAIDDAILAVQVFHNCAVYDIFTNHMNTTEKEKKRKGETSSSEIVHFVDLSSVMKKEYKDKLTEEHPIISKCPQSAITTNVGLKADMKKEFGKNPIEYQKPQYYNKKHPRTSYTYGETFGKIRRSENENMFYINLAVVGLVKVRGWNRNIRFDHLGNTTFLDYAENNKKESVTVVVSKDNCGDYWICFKIKECYKPMKCISDKKVGVDVGIKDIAILSDGTKFCNQKFKKQEKKHMKALNRRMSRRNGWANEEFRALHKQNKELTPSKRYERTKMAFAKLQRKIARKRNLWNNTITRKIVEDNGFIGIESLNVSGMNKNRHISFALSDAAIGYILQMLKYKSDWHKRIIQPIDMWSPSSKRCSCCGRIRPKLSLSIRDWICEECSTHHDRDVNAAKNILYYAMEIYFRH